MVLAALADRALGAGGQRDPPRLARGARRERVIAAIVLAAGRSSRFGSQKLLAPIAGKPLVRWTVERVLASGVDRTFVVVPEGDHSIPEVLSDLRVDFVTNRAP